MKIKNLKDKLWTIGLGIVAAIAIIFPIALSNYPLFADNDVYVAFNADKGTAQPNEVITYTLFVKNRTSQDITNVLAAATVDPNTTYVPGSGTFYRGGSQFQIPDSWYVDRLNMGTIIPGQENRVAYQVRVNSGVSNGTSVTGVGYILPEGMTTQSYQFSTAITTNTGQTQFQGGDVFQAVNNTLGEDNWRDQVNAIAGNVIQFKFRIVNSGSVEARNVKVRVELPWDAQNPSTALVSRATATADNASALIDTVAVNLTGVPSYFVPRPGHYYINGATSLYDCPNGCPLPNNFLWNPLLIGTMAPGATAEITFKADIVNIPSSSPTPTPSPSPSPTPTPTPTPSASPTPTPSASPTPTPSPQVLGTTAPTRLPETGDDTGVLLVLAGIGFGIVGVYLFKRFRLV